MLWCIVKRVIESRWSFDKHTALILVIELLLTPSLNITHCPSEFMLCWNKWNVIWREENNRVFCSNIDMEGLTFIWFFQALLLLQWCNFIYAFIYFWVLHQWQKYKKSCLFGSLLGWVLHLGQVFLTLLHV